MLPVGRLNREGTKIMTTHISTHEQYIQAVRDAIVTGAVARGTITTEQADQLNACKLVYGVGQNGVRGTTWFRAWQNGHGPADVVEVAAMTQESYVQLAGTTLHELAHVLAGATAGHNVAWKDTAVALGMVKRPAAAGQVYHLAMLAPWLREQVYRLAARIGDGTPGFLALLAGGGGAPILGTSPIVIRAPRPCSAGTGVRGGTSSGRGSGSRLRLWLCECDPNPVKVRVASDDFQATCQRCDSPFKRG
jgi:hypothetical protein